MNLLLADDHPLFLDGLKNLLSGRGLDVMGTARDGLEALEKARKLRPDVILMDIEMPRCDGLAATRLIKAELPEVKIVMLTMSANDDDVFEAIKSGACGYLLKTEDTEHFFSRLMELAQGEAPLSPGLAARILEQFGREGSAAPQNQGPVPGGPLTEREMEVLTLVAQGLTYKAVATKLCVTERTIKYHMGEMIARLQLHNRKEMIEYARRSGLVNPRRQSS